MSVTHIYGGSRECHTYMGGPGSVTHIWEAQGVSHIYIGGPIGGIESVTHIYGRPSKTKMSSVVWMLLKIKRIRALKRYWLNVWFR